jgi:TRAP-type C4-dicarboxylate transport system permease large subunit
MVSASIASMSKPPPRAIVREAVPLIFAAIGVLAVISLVPEAAPWLPRDVK